MQNIDKILQRLNFLGNSKVHCNDFKEEASMDNPAYGKLDPHLDVEDDPEMQQMMQPGRKRYPRRPPSFDVMLNSVKAITKKTEHIKGFKFDLSGVLSNNFLIGNSWYIPYSSKAGAASAQQMQRKMQKPTEGHYTLSTQYLGGTLRTQMDEPSYIVTGRMDTTGRLEATIIKKLNNYITFRLQSMFPNSDIMYAHMNLDVDIEGDDYQHTLKYGTGMWSANMMQTIGQNLVLGFEFMNLQDRKYQLNYNLKYQMQHKHHFYMQYYAPAESVTLAYALWIQKKAQLISELEVNTNDGTTSSILGYRQKFANTEVIATLNSKGKIGTVMNITGFAYQLKLCSIANYLKHSYKFGYGISMGQGG